MTPLLSICIPTYNRANYLKKCLETILASAKGQEQLIEINVSNNNSNDETEDIVKQFQKSYDFVHYNRNEINTGIENFYIVAARANAEYLWLFGDDDLMEKEAIKKVLDKIKAGYNPIIVNYSVWINNFKDCIKEKGLHFKHDLIINNNNIFLSKFGIHMGYISSVILKKQSFFTLPIGSIEKHLNFGFPHLFSVYSGFPSKINGYFYSQTLVKNRNDNSNVTDCEEINLSKTIKVFMIAPAMIYDELFLHNYSSQAISKAKWLIIKEYIIGYLIYRKWKGRRTKGLFKTLYPYYKKELMFWMLCVPLLILPDKLCGLIYRLKKTLAK